MGILTQEKYKIEVKKASFGTGGGFLFLVWRGLNISASGYGFTTAVEAANAGLEAKKDLIEADKISKTKV